jgi:hypothetical protein
MVLSIENSNFEFITKSCFKIVKIFFSLIYSILLVVNPDAFYSIVIGII